METREYDYRQFTLDSEILLISQHQRTLSATLWRTINSVLSPNLVLGITKILYNEDNYILSVLTGMWK